MTADATLNLAERYFAAIVASRFDELEAMCTPDLCVWHNFTGKTQSLDENLRMLRWVTNRLEDYRYEDVVRFPVPSGFVQQHVLCGRVGEAEVRVPTCLVVKTRNGKIARIDEYLNSADLGPLNG